MAPIYWAHGAVFFAIAQLSCYTLSFLFPTSWFLCMFIDGRGVKAGAVGDSCASYHRWLTMSLDCRHLVSFYYSTSLLFYPMNFVWLVLYCQQCTYEGWSISNEKNIIKFVISYMCHMRRVAYLFISIHEKSIVTWPFSCCYATRFCRLLRQWRAKWIKMKKALWLNI